MQNIHSTNLFIKKNAKYSFKEFIHSSEKWIIAQGYPCAVPHWSCSCKKKRSKLQFAPIWVGCHSSRAIGRRHLFRLASPWGLGCWGRCWEVRAGGAPTQRGLVRARDPVRQLLTQTDRYFWFLWMWNLWRQKYHIVSLLHWHDLFSGNFHSNMLRSVGILTFYMAEGAFDFLVEILWNY